MSFITKLVNTSLESSLEQPSKKNNWVISSALLYSMILINYDFELEDEVMFLGGTLALNWFMTLI